MLDTESETRLPPPQPYYPTTFLERGVAVPFTTPLLDGSRARPGDRTGVELIVPNPSGGRGVYILPWGGVCQLCRPTVHDARLNQKIVSLPNVTPGTIRRTARHVAAEGLAGDDAMEAARARAETEQSDRLLTNFLLLMALIDAADPAHQRGLHAQYQRTRELEEYARRTVVKVAPQLGMAAESISEALEALADVLCAVGLRQQTSPARVPRLLKLLRDVCGDIGSWARRRDTDDVTCYAEMVRSVADVTLTCADTTLRDAHALTTDIFALLNRWSRDPEEVSGVAARPEWLLDGWERICLLWTIAGDEMARRAALVEMAQLVPVLPREVSEWVGAPVATDQPITFHHTVRLNEDWRTGATVFDLIARNEHLRALEI